MAEFFKTTLEKVDSLGNVGTDPACASEGTVN